MTRMRRIPIITANTDIFTSGKPHGEKHPPAAPELTIVWSADRYSISE
jgi:hypothetical protein